MRRSRRRLPACPVVLVFWAKTYAYWAKIAIVIPAWVSFNTV